MKHRCRGTLNSSIRRRQFAIVELLRHARVVTDPLMLAYLTAKVARCKGEAERERVRAKLDPRVLDSRL